MRSLIVLLVIAVCIAGLGFYRGWFRLTSNPTADESNITLTVDKDKMQEDKQKAVDKVQGAGHQSKDQQAAPVQPATSK